MEQYGITITRPWSKAMYNHKDQVLKRLKQILRKQLLLLVEPLDPDNDWLDETTPELTRIQRAICFYRIGSGYQLKEAWEMILRDLDRMPYWHAKQTAEQLDLELEPGFIGLNWH